MKNQHFTVGPAQLFYTVEGHLKQALKEDIPSISHRGKQFSSIFEHASNGIRTMFNIPDSHYIAFTGSATEVWERIVQNTVITESFHLVNGAFSEKFASVSEHYGKKVIRSEAKWGECVEVEKLLVPETAELIAITHNETSTGAMYRNEDIEKVAKAFPDQLIAVDIVSSAPAVSLDWSLVDTVYFSVQKGFGLPAGLGVWIFNERCLEKSHKLLDMNMPIGSYHCLPELVKNLKKNQTPATPNVLGIYLLGKVVEDMLNAGMDRINREIIYKAAILYQALEQAEGLSPFVKNNINRSKTTIVAEGPAASALKTRLADNRLIVSTGYTPFQEEHIRIANFPAHSKEQMEMLVDLIVKGQI